MKENSEKNSEENSEENSIVSQYIDKIKKQTSGDKNYIYRGQSQQYNGVNSTFFRRFEKTKIDNPSKLKYIEYHKEYHKDLIRDAKNNRYDKDLSEIELLLTLQHYGCATSLIDFSQDFLIALWFACNNSDKGEDKDKDGRLFYLDVRIDELEHTIPNGKDNTLQLPLDTDKAHYIEPAFKINNRIFAQKGVFVFGYQNINKGFGLDSIVINEGDKKSIRKELKQYFSIDEKSLFPDIYGFSYVNNVEHPLTTKTEQDYFEEAYNESDNKVKIKLYKEAIKIKPESDSYYNMGNAYDNLKNYQQAISAYEKAIDIKHDYSAAYNNMGIAYYGLKDYQQAISAYEKAIEIKPDHNAAYCNMGNAYKNLTEYQQAINAYEKAIEIKPDSDAYNSMGDAYNNLTDYQQAINAYKKAIEIKPDSDAYYSMGYAYYDLTDYQQAINAYKKAIEIKPDYSDAYYNMGIAYNKLMKYQQAISAYKKAIEIKPDNSDAYNNMGAVYNNLKEYQQAISAYKKAIEIKPDHSAAYYNMGNTYYDLKEYQQAINAYKKAIEINPKLINRSKTKNWDAIKAWINTQPESIEKQEYLEIIAKLEVISHPI